MTTQTEDAMAEITRLRDQLETLIRDKAGPVVENAAASVDSVAGDLADIVRGRPLVSLAIAAGVGFLLGRVSR